MNKRQQRLVAQLEQCINPMNRQQIGPWVVWYGEVEPLRVSATVRDVHGLVRRGLLEKVSASPYSAWVAKGGK